MKEEHEKKLKLEQEKIDLKLQQMVEAQMKQHLDMVKNLGAQLELKDKQLKEKQTQEQDE